MKKIMLIVAAMAFVTTVTLAQDSTRTESQQPTEQQQSPEQTPSQDYTKDMVKIKSEELPEAVKQTLAAPQYQGWESSTIYRSRNNDMYIVEIGSGTEAKTHRFGADGKPQVEK